MRGPLTQEPVTLQAAKLWDKANKDVTVTITFPQAAEFNFTAGTLTSEYLDGAAVKMAVSKQGQIVLPTNFAELGIGDSCYRLIAHLDKTANGTAGPKIRYTVLFFPRLVADLEDLSDLAKGAGWPGVKVLEGEATLFPGTRSGSWGCPLLPILCPGARLELVPVLPPGSELRHAISKIMGPARLPTAMASNRTMTAKWKKLLDGSEDYEERLPTVTWPEAARPTPDTGKQNIKYCNKFAPVYQHCLEKQRTSSPIKHHAPLCEKLNFSAFLPFIPLPPSPLMELRHTEFTLLSEAKD